MAYYSGYVAKVIVTDIPIHFSKSKLQMKLEAVAGKREILGIEYVTKSSVIVHLSDDEAKEKLLKAQIVVAFGERRFPLTVAQFGDDNLDKDDDSDHDTEDEDVYTYEPPDKDSKAILRYLSKTPAHENSLKLALRKCGSKLINVSQEEIVTSLPKNGVRPEQVCEDRIKHFMERFSTWNETLDNCSSDDDKHIISILTKYKAKCFGIWFKNTSTVLVTGPKEVVKEVKELVEKLLDGRHTERESVQQPNSRAQPFNFEGVQPAIMRFVMKQVQFNNELLKMMANLAHVAIEEKEKKLTIVVSPNVHTSSCLHSEFEKSCKDMLRAFFRNFDSWRGKFDPISIQTMKARSPSFFTKTSYPDHFVQWHYDTGMVNVTGTRPQVSRCKLLLESMFHGPTASSGLAPQSFPGMLLAQPLRPMPYVSVSPVWPPAMPSIPTSNISVSPSRAASGRRRSRNLSSGEISDDQPSPSKNEMLSYDAEDVPGAVLKFVCNDSASRKGLEGCCKRIAKVSIKNDHGQIKIDMIFKNKDNSPANKRKADSLIEEYFSKFDAQTKKYSTEKLKDMLKSAPELFSNEPGVLFIASFVDTGTVKITGLKEEVSRKESEIENEMHAEIEVELLPAEIYIAQRECKVWAKVNALCKQKKFAVSISSTEPGMIQYKGRPQFIIKAKKSLGKVSERLYEEIVKGLSPAQLKFLSKFVKLQQDFLKTKENKLDAIYNEFRKKSLQGSLMLQQSVEVKLICPSRSVWEKTMDLLSKLITYIEVDLSTTSKVAPFSKLSKSLKSKLGDLMVHVDSQVDTKKVLVYCLNFQKPNIQTRVREIQKQICNTEEDEKFYPMPEERAKHILNPHSQCKVHQVKTMDVVQRNGKWGLAVTYDKEDIDTVDMSFEDLKSGIVHKNLKISGYSLYECLDSDNKQYLVERETNCSIFLKPEGQVQCTNIFSVKEGDILNEKCEALINSTGKSFNFSGQVSQAMARKYGKNALDMTLQSGQWLIKEKAFLCRTSGLFPWTYIINVNTPAREDTLKKFILELLLRADSAGIKSMAMPTIGAGNLGMDPVVVAKCLKEAFHSFIAQPVSSLKDVRVVVYERSLLPAFKDIAPKQDSRSTAVLATIYGNSEASLERAAEKLKEVSKTYIASRVIEDASMCQFTPYVKAQAREICDNNGVQLIWRQYGNQEQGLLHGITDSVKRAEDDIRKLIEADFPANWSVMENDQIFIKEHLDKASQEYIQVKAKFDESSPVYVNILKIERIQNPLMYRQFKTRKDSKRTEYLSQPVTKRLFHGTSADKVDKICATGFDRNYAGENGTAYGKGVYFAVKSSYSVRYANISGNPLKCIFVAEVITGDFTQGSSTYKAPPEKGSSKILYDSVVDNVTDPRIYVVFHDTSVYPLYLITFC